MRGNVFAVTALLCVALGVGGKLPAEAKEKPVVVGKGSCSCRANQTVSFGNGCRRGNLCGITILP